MSSKVRTPVPDDVKKVLKNWKVEACNKDCITASEGPKK